MKILKQLSRFLGGLRPAYFGVVVFLALHAIAAAFAFPNPYDFYSTGAFFWHWADKVCEFTPSFFMVAVVAGAVKAYWPKLSRFVPAGNFRAWCLNYPVLTGVLLYAAVNLAQFIGIWLHHSTFAYSLEWAGNSDFYLFEQGMPPFFRTAAACAVVVIIVRELSRGRK